MAAEATQVRPQVGPSSTPEPVFVFGSDLGGRHDQYGAAFAVRVHQAESGKASGLTGNAYAIPYRNTSRDLLPLETIRHYVSDFLTHAAQEPSKSFQVSRFACETGAYADSVMAQLFARAPSNCQLPGLWLRELDLKMPARLLLFDPTGALKDRARLAELRSYLSLNAPLWNAPSVELVSVGNARAIVGNDVVAKSLGLKHRVFGVNEAYYGREAASAAEIRAVGYATHFLAICSFDHTASPAQIRLTATATRGGLPIDQIDINAE